ncbi:MULTISPECIES: hypothetical protein [Vibrio]|uniref:RDD family protein n=2 Tax=Vibrio TaxID=662 RepID=A0A975UB23_9VIBR|nr:MULTISPECIES: hypothetical protein [Vibrio]QXO18230.1 hypothetical protein KNV97_08070 [Vibrio ostreae]WGY47447.1 hypothetical protein J0X00_07195 [Vibrio sp. ABG19]
MNSGDKFRRTGAFIIDLMVAKMFTQAVMSVLMVVVTGVFAEKSGGMSLNDNLALPVLLLIVLAMLLIFIGIYLGFSTLCFKLIGKSLGKYLLRVDSGQWIKAKDLSTYLSREKEKIVFFCATLGLYAAYSAIQLYMYNVEPLHETRARSKA